MKYVIIGLALLAGPVQAATWDAQDCDFVELFFQECARGPQESVHFGLQCQGIASESEANRLTEFERRHPEFRVKHLDKVCDRVCHEQMTPAKATAKFCRRGRSRSLTLGVSDR